MCVAARRALFEFDTVKCIGAIMRRIDEVKVKYSRILNAKCLTFLTSKDDFLVAATNGPLEVNLSRVLPHKLETTWF